MRARCRHVGPCNAECDFGSDPGRYRAAYTRQHQRTLAERFALAAVVLFGARLVLLVVALLMGW